jgi:hypothetical protein
VSLFPSPLRLVRTAPRKAVVEGDFVFLSPSKGRIVVEDGFDTDYASTPRILWPLYPPDGKYTEAAVVHDKLYWDQPMTREEADAVFLEAMEALGVPWLRRHLLHKSVRIGGWAAWNANQKRRKREVA